MGKLKIQERTALNSRVSRYTTLLLGTTALVCAGAAQAQTSNSNDDMSSLSFPEMFQKQVVEGSQVHGRVGFYDFRRWHDTNQPYPGQAKTGDNYNTENTNFGAQIGITTGRLYGFSAGAEFVYEHALYGNNAAGTKLNCNLACSTVENLTQGYLQFNAYGFQLRGGRQLINTPLAGADQFTFLPRAFQGVSAVWRPLDTMKRMSFTGGGSAKTEGNSGPQINQSSVAQTATYETNQYLPFFGLDASAMDQPEWQVFGAKITRYEGRGNSSSFVKKNRYFDNVSGFWSLGTSYRNVMSNGGQVVGQYYHYDFQQTESADYGEIGYMAPTMGSGTMAWAPYVRAQAIAAYNADKSRIPQGINSQIYGLKLGVQSGMVGFSVFANFSPEHNNSFNHGQLLHPYTDLSGVIYTDTMNDGIQEQGPGWAAGARIDFTPTDNFSMYARYVQYEAKYGHSHDFYFGGGSNGQIGDGRNGNPDSFTGTQYRNQKSQGIGIGMTYDLGGISKQLAGLKIGDNLGITKFDHAPNFYDNRIRFYYSF
ncbi:hypothetical protein [Salinisphaera sp. LB1]|uniref:hypothetical protein n=1 Tax=Salinisphaera sp. LB1 TaxID=2183911 RepID=UPI000D7D3B45|nr:hypothetical protein [Salinisphaera sp. LB1]AWN16663.1 hypothetical protein SALB1_2465 [Salinisphaera sp. LB1]